MMIRRNVLFALFLLCLNFLQAQDIPEAQQPMVTKITASWCPPCGGWAWEAFEKIYDDNDSKALVLANNYSGDLFSYTADQIAKNFGAFGQPLFYLNNERLSVSSSNYQSIYTSLNEEIESRIQMDPLANTGIFTKLDGRSLTVDAKTKFFKNTSGDFFLGIYIIENGVVNYQATRGDNAIHKNVLRESMTPDGAFGVMIANGEIAENSEFNKTFTMDIPQNWDINNIFIATIIWKFVNGNYQYVNSYNHLDWQNSTSSLHDLSDVGATLEIQNNYGRDFTTIYTNTHLSSSITYQLIDVSGKTISTRTTSRVNQTQDVQKWETSTLSPGIYFIRILEDKGQLVRKVMVK